MIKASAPLKDGAALVLLGLSDENVKRLTDDQPVMVKPEDIKKLLGGKELGGIVIFHGATEADIKATMVEQGLIGEGTRYDFD